MRLNKYNYDGKVQVDLEGVVDIAFTKFYNNINLFDPSKSIPKTYLFTIGLNQLRAEHKNKRLDLEYREEIFDCDILGLNEQDETDISYTKKRKPLKSFINHLDDDVKRIVYMKIYGFSLVEISEKMNLTINQVKHKLYKKSKKEK
jgi:RNA polymerase sigma factor (sigma-70 family)